MKTIEERASLFAGAYPHTDEVDLPYIVKEAYIAAAPHQKQIDIDKACEVFCIESKCRNRVNLACRQTCEKLKCFRKAMEE